MSAVNEPMTFAQKELRTRLTSAFQLGICKTGSPVYLVPNATGQDAQEANVILEAVRSFGDAHRPALLKFVDFAHLDTEPSERQAQMAQDIVSALWQSGDEWRPVLEGLLQNVGSHIYVPLRALLSLVAVHAIASEITIDTAA